MQLDWKLFFSPLFLLALLVGGFLRLYQITLQIPADDEWHAIHQILYFDYAGIAATFGGADYCIPLALFYEFCLNRLFLSEMVLRAPALAAGLASVALFPLLLRGFWSRRAAAILALLLAISPLHIYFSRYARPYSIVLLLAVLGVVGFYRWWSGGDVLWRGIYIGSAILAPYFHLSALSVVNAPFLFALLELVFDRKGGSSRIRGFLITGLTVGVGQLVLLAPPALHDFYSLEGKMGKGRIPDLAAVEGALQLLSGTSVNVLVALFFAGAFTGLAFLFGRRKRFALYLCVLIGSQFWTALILLPSAIHIPIVLVRYNLFALPALLWFVAICIDRTGEILERRRLFLPTAWVAAVIAGLLFFFGPLSRTYYYPNNWTQHGLFQYSYDWEDRRFSYRNILEPDEVPAFYRELSEREPGSMILLEAPWYFAWHDNLYPFYQMVHRQKMMIGFVSAPGEVSRPGEFHPDTRGMSFHSFLHVGEFDDLGRIDNLSFVVFHKRLAEEVPNVAPRRGVDVSHWIEEYRKRLGEPRYEDDWIVVFDVRNLE